MIVSEVGDLGGDLIECPFCAEPIKRKALKCKHCGELLGGAPAPVQSEPQKPSTPAASSPPPAKEAKPKYKDGAWPIMAFLTLVGMAGLASQAAGHADRQRAWVIAAASFVVLGPLAWRIGDAIRRLALPGKLYVTGGFGEIVKQKLFWRLGPQAFAMLWMAIGVGFVASTHNAPNLGSTSTAGNSTAVGNVVAAVAGNAPPNVANEAGTQEPEPAQGATPVGNDQSAQEAPQESEPAQGASLAGNDQSAREAPQANAEEPNRTPANCDGGTKAAQLVCADTDLAGYDRQVAAALEGRRASESRMSWRLTKWSQKIWIESVRDKCEDKYCLVEAYSKRLAELAGADR